MRITMLGCGSSAGVPLIGCDCAVCTSSDPKNTRSRVSVLIETDGKNILIDTSPDLRLQALKNRISRIDTVLYTHDHADHTHGIDELRSFNHLANKDIPVYARADVLESLRIRFDYAFKERPKHAWFRPSLNAVAIPDGSSVEFDVLGLKFTAFEQIHGKTTTLGFRIGDFAYSTDVNELSEQAIHTLQDTQVWFVDCLKYTPSFSHSHLERTLDWIAQVNPNKAVLTHMTHDFDYKTLKAELPHGVEPGYDGLIVDL